MEQDFFFIEVIATIKTKYFSKEKNFDINL